MSPLDEDQPGVVPEEMTVVDQQIGQPTFALNFIARPAGEFRQRLADMQAGMAADLPGGVFTCPLDSLHLTIAPIIWARGTYDFDVRHWWAENADAGLKDLTRIASDSSAFSLICAELQVHPGAIVIRFNPSPVLDALRDAVNTSPMFKDVIVETIDFTHVTLFRFEKAMPISDLAEAVERHAVPQMDWAVNDLVLCQEEIYPSLECADITRIPLTD